MRIYHFLAALALAFPGALTVAAQDLPATPAVAVPATQARYFSATGKLLPTAEGADHREDQIYRDSLGGMVRIYYPSGKLRRLVPYAHFGYGVKYGVETSFYETGELKSRCEYTLNGPVGYYTQYYRTGKVRLRTPVGDDLPSDAKAEAFEPDGQPRTDAQARNSDKMPKLAGGGQQEIMTAVMRAVRYPPEALRAQVTGRVLVTFMVDDAGFVRNVKIEHSPSPLLNPAALAAVASLGRLTPGEMAGEPVDIFYRVPITFEIR